MPDAPTKLQRWLDLIAYLVGRRLPVTVEELMEQVPAYSARWREGDETARASAKRMFERDKDELRRAGIPIRTVRYTVNFGMEELEGYRLDRRDFYLPYVRLVADRRGAGGAAGPSGIASFEIAPPDLDLAVRALRHVSGLPSFPYESEARSALRKLTFDLEPGTDDDAAPVLYMERAGQPEVRAQLRELSEALLQRKRVRFRYHGLYRDEETEREVLPYGLLFHQGHWYLVGHDASREAVRVFRAGRMRDVARNTRTPNTPDYAVPADFRMEAHVGRRAWEFHGEEDESVTALVRFRFPLSLWAARAGHGRVVDHGEDGSTVRAFEVRQVDPFVRWLLSFEDEVTVLEPAELRRAVRTVAADIAALHRTSGRGVDA